MSNANLFQTEDRLSSKATWACNVYAMVPYLGILFLPVAFVLGGVDYRRAVRKRRPKEARVAIASLALSLFLLGGQLLLWRLLYIIPELGI